MAVCLQDQAVYTRREGLYVSMRVQIASALVLMLALFVKVWVQNESVEVGYRAASERERAVQLDMERREFELEISVLQRPDEVSRRARLELGMVPLRAAQARRVS